MKQPTTIAAVGISLLSSTLMIATVSHATPPQIKKTLLSLQQGSEQVNPGLPREQPSGLSPSRRVNPGVPRIKPKPLPPQTPAPNPVTHNYRVKMWFTVDNTNDGAFDNQIECYGELRIDGELYWQIPREDADNNQKQKGQSLEVSDSRYARKEFIFNKPKIDYEISLKDADGGSSDDDVYQGNRRNFNLEALAGQGELVYKFQNSKTFESSYLRIRVEKIGN